MALISRGTGSAFFRGLSSFWKRFFRDSSVLQTTYDATETLLGDVYLDLMEAVLSKSLRNTEIFSRRDWRLLLLNDSDLGFDSAVFSFGVGSLNATILTITAQELSNIYDGHSVTVANSENLTDDQRLLYPAYGVYNVGHVTGVDVRKKLWVAVVPTGGTIADSISTLANRVISNKRLESFVASTTNSVDILTLNTLVNLNSVGNWDADTNSPAIPTATPSNVGQYFQVSVAGTTTIDGTSIWAVGDWIVSEGTHWVKAALELPKVIFKYGDDLTEEIAIPAGDYTDIDGLRQELVDQITAINLTMSFDFNVNVEVDGVRLVITSDKEIILWEANTSFQNLYSMVPFKFKITTDVPAGRESEFLWDQTDPLQLLTDGFRIAGIEYRFPIDTKIKESKYIYNTLYKPSITLESSRQYRIANGFIYFKSNPFEFDSIAFRDLGDGRRQLALWMSLVDIDNLSLYFNYGYRFTKVRESSEAYKAFIKGIYYYYTHGPQVSRLKSAFNILAGIPVAEENDETVLGVSLNGLTVTTDKNVYELPPQSPAVVTAGQVLQAFDALTDAFRVEDYISNPDWFDRIVIPDFLMPEASLGLRVSSVTTFIPLVGDTGYIVGDVTTDAATLLTNPITPAVDYSLSAVALFNVEKDNNGKIYKFAVPTEITSGATTLLDMIAYLKETMKQLLGNPVNGAGGNIFRLQTDATFDITVSGVTYPIVVTPADTAGAFSLGDLALIVKNIVDTALGGTNVVHTFGILDTSSLTLVPHEAADMIVSNLNVSAADELGLFEFTSLTGINLNVVDTTKIEFSSNTVGSTTRVDITGMNNIALAELEMDPFRQGSGDYVGNDGDPSPGWDIMNDYLKFNVFKITFNASTISFQDDNISIQDIVLSGRPLYTSALITPEFDLFETVVGSSDDTIEDPDAFLATIDPNETILADVRAKKGVTVYVSEPYAQNYRRDPLVDTKYISLPDTHAEFDFLNVSTDGGTLRFESTDEGLTRTDHILEVTDIDNIKAEDISLFSSVGIFNRGKILDGIHIPVSSIPAGTLGGIHKAHLRGDTPFGHWLEGFQKADMSIVSTHVFVIDDAMKLAGLDPFTEGVKEGDFIKFANFADGGNNGEFAIQDVFRNVQYKNEESGGSPILVDLLFFRNNRIGVTTNENFADSTVPPGATTAFRSGNPPNKSWIIILPNTGTVSARISGLLAATGDNKDIFPFDTAYVPEITDSETWVPPGVGSYYEGLTHDGDPPNETFFGHFFKISWDTNPANGDEEAQNPGAIPHGYTHDTMGVVGIVGNGSFLQEVYDYDYDPVGLVSRTPGDLTNPYLLGVDDAGINLYADYDEALKLNNNDTKFGEITFYRGIQ